MNTKVLINIATALIISFIAGGVEMRVAVGRLETSVGALDKRVQRIEHDIDAQRSVAKE